MIPESGNLYESKIVEYPTYTFKVDKGSKRIITMSDGLEAMDQAINVCLNIERYDYQIYSSNLGRELGDLIGKEPEYVMSMIKKRVKEALLIDNRITSVDSFIFDIPKTGLLECSFIVHTVYGDTTATVGVET